MMCCKLKCVVCIGGVLGGGGGVIGYIITTLTCSRGYNAKDWYRGNGASFSPPSGRSFNEKATRSMALSSDRSTSSVWNNPPCTTITASLTIVNMGR